MSDPNQGERQKAEFLPFSRTIAREGGRNVNFAREGNAWPHLHFYYIIYDDEVYEKKGRNFTPASNLGKKNTLNFVLK